MVGRQRDQYEPGVINMLALQYGRGPLIQLFLRVISTNLNQNYQKGAINVPVLGLY
jgi:hypothetical protein